MLFQSLDIPKMFFASRIFQTVKLYMSLTKATIGVLVAITTLPTIFVGQTTLVNPSLIGFTLFGTLLLAASGAVLNSLIDRDLDVSMGRTKARPTVSGQISVKEGAVFASSLGLIGFCLLYFGTTPLAALIGVIGHVFYAGIYSLYLKKWNEYNIVVGGVAGAVGPLIGSAAVNGNINIEAWLLFALIFMWTPAHFWALALFYKEDYAKAGVPMMPVVRGDAYTRYQILLYAVSLVAVIGSLCWLGRFSTVSDTLSLALTFHFVWESYRLYRQKNNERCLRVFYVSCFYLLLVFSIMTLDAAIALAGT